MALFNLSDGNSKLSSSKVSWVKYYTYKGFAYTEDNVLFGTSLVRTGLTSIFPSTKATLSEFDSKTYLNNEIISDITASNQFVLILTKEKNVYGSGTKNYLGLGTTSVEPQYTPIPLFDDGDIVSITSGPTWSIIVKSDGSVLGTGSNEYGVLGRWIGIDRNSPNSRYKTAFDWVECPELEI